MCLINNNHYNVVYETNRNKENNYENNLIPKFEQINISKNKTIKKINIYYANNDRTIKYEDIEHYIKYKQNINILKINYL